MDNPRFTAFVMHIVLLVVFLGLINMIFDLSRLAFIGEFLILIAFLLMAIISAVGINSNLRWAWILLTVLFALIFLDMLFVYVISAVKPALFFHLVFAVIAGFFIALFSIEEPKEEVEEVKKTYKPGKYVASKMGKTYHSPKCDWAKRIKKRNMVWFDSMQDAQGAGHKAHECIK